MTSITIDQYIEHFCGPNKKGEYPGEHHFVALYLIPLLLKKMSADDLSKLSYINPDGMKSFHSKGKPIFDITLDGIGLEIKYALGTQVKFTKCQLDQFSKSEKSFKGVIALIKIASTPEVWFIGPRDLQRRIPNPIRKYETDDTVFSRNEVEWTQWELKSVEENFLKLFHLSNT